eukprot:CAMPEP_0175842412 /NCGR_PEP_ID=MMETSP0107_2-20121207/20486_1 /TAXON_ID=195067 ORGANISM="Goniomonas pacifica, Strain CCMP1869" /NCGR_SAMPLE_ID=MMETSP0107_2 /ASSEMBLY_ACC=CAM_ASM_000203 /LENGTH=64 /DNA_ID=CAMNT_0017156519 /DNA_START=102 /DNA_END=296 /DNA_ORIENTATION=+
MARPTARSQLSMSSASSAAKTCVPAPKLMTKVKFFPLPSSRRTPVAVFKDMTSSQAAASAEENQ